MNRKSKIIVSVVGITIVLLALLGITYAYYLTRIEGNTNTNSISVSTADLKLKYDDGNGNIVEEDIMPGKVITKEFSVTNEGQSKVNGYLVVLEQVHNTLNRKEDLVYTLDCKLQDSTSCGVITETIYPSNSLSVIFTNDIEIGVTHYYTLTVTYKNHDNIDQSEDMGKSFSGRVNIMDSSTNIYKTGTSSIDDKNLAYNIINNAMTGTQRTNATIYSPTPLTEPAKSVSAQEERTLSLTQDYYGTSYYFRGNVEDNYVNFAGMCWRIVRIAGDGSTKLILEDQYTECDDTINNNTDNNESTYYTGAWNIPASNGESITMNGDNLFLAGSYGLDNSTYSGKYIASYLNPITMSERSMVNAFKYFQTHNLDGFTSKLTSGNWCYNDTAYDDVVGTNIIDKNNYYNGTTSGLFYYDSYVRLRGSERKPTLKCNGTIMNRYNDESDMLVGALTADEIVYAGAKCNNMNTSYYLLNTYQIDNSLWFWSLSPSYFDGDRDRAFYVNYNGYLGDSDVTVHRYSFRPSVFLRSDVEISSGDGTKMNPYDIEV